MNDSAERTRLMQILQAESIQRGHFVLASGRTSDYYLDCRRTTLHPEGAYLIGRQIFSLMARMEWPADAIGGLTLGADPIATAVAVVSHLEKRPIPAFLVRKESKKHGTGQQIEGAPPAGSRVVVVEDVVTSGGSALKACDACEAAGLEVLGIAAVVDREEGGSEAVEARGLRIVSLFTARELLG